jgi:hypothetical protein
VEQKKRLEEELRAQRDADDKARQEVNEIRSAESQKKSYVVDDRIATPPSSNEPLGRGYEDQRQMSAEARRLATEERRQHLEDEANLRRANAEVERQKRFLEQIERENQYEKARREAASRPGR